jgi:hypothetical protein
VVLRAAKKLLKQNMLLKNGWLVDAFVYDRSSLAPVTALDVLSVRVNCLVFDSVVSNCWRCCNVS